MTYVEEYMMGYRNLYNDYRKNILNNMEREGEFLLEYFNTGNYDINDLNIIKEGLLDTIKEFFKKASSPDSLKYINLELL